jgi:hypothetical protein
MTLISRDRSFNWDDYEIGPASSESIDDTKSRIRGIRGIQKSLAETASGRARTP